MLLRNNSPKSYQEFKISYKKRSSILPELDYSAITNEVVINTVEEYLNTISQIYSRISNKEIHQRKEIVKSFAEKLWFRGLKSDKYDLYPSISRNDLNTDYEIIYLSKFKSLTIPYLENLPGFPFNQGTPSYWGWLFQMQHYGLPTRLLDWTEDALIALLFACSSKNDSENEEDSAVWLLNPVKMNEAFTLYDFLPKGYIPNVEEDKVYEMFGPNSSTIPDNIKPIAAIGPLNNPRIVAQKGVFTIYPYIKNIVPLNRLGDSAGYLYKINISKDKCSEIISQLKIFGFTEPSLYPEVEQIANRIKAGEIFKQ